MLFEVDIVIAMHHHYDDRFEKIVVGTISVFGKIIVSNLLCAGNVTYDVEV